MARLQFPYMFWAHTHAVRSAYCLSQSGMPTADAGIFAGVGGIDLGHPSAEALPSLEAKVASVFGVDPRRVIAVLGASGGMHTAALRYFRPGSRVVVDVPSYEPFRALPSYLGAEVRPLRRRVEDAWQIDPAEVRRLLARGGGPGHVFLSNLHNPSGALLERETLVEIARAAESAGGVAIVCEVYMEYVPAARRVHAFDVAPNGISVGSLTKAYGLGPLRIGWIILGEGLVHERDALRDMTYLSYVDPPTVCLRAGVRALERLDDLLRPLAVIEHESRPIWERWLRETPGVKASVPEFGIIAFPLIEGVNDTLALAEFLAAEHEVDVVPGEFFGTPGHLRIGCGVPAETLRVGLERLTAGLAAWRAKPVAR
ncbi:MAG: pyridoxal phosphate-dependent aminotransferase [Planctomycetota bacterium]